MKDPQSEKEQAFVTWKFQGIAFIAARNGDGYGIADAAGNYYGAWQDPGNFRRLQRAGDSDSRPIGKLSGISVRAA
jgi:hypothetical protein